MILFVFQVDSIPNRVKDVSAARGGGCAYLNPVAVGSLVVRASDSRPKGLGSIPDATKHPPSTHGFTYRNCGGGDRGRVAIYRPFGEFRRAKSHCHLYGSQGQRQAYLLPMPR
ncbi:hypothetical protein TNCV_3739951 [Trichonephila clavipes]|nr:hypothetical protein TNCV_3739951 [Trichonephila clavipes]